MSDLSEFRRSKDEFYAGGHDSPLTEHQMHGFKGLKYFDDDPGLRFVLTPEEFESQDAIEMQTSTGDVAQFVRWGRISFEVADQNAQLTLLKDAGSGEFFLPFVDATSGHETYAPGRYLDVEELPDGLAYVPREEPWRARTTPAEQSLLALDDGEAKPPAHRVDADGADHSSHGTSRMSGSSTSPFKCSRRSSSSTTSRSFAARSRT